MRVWLVSWDYRWFICVSDNRRGADIDVFSRLCWTGFTQHPGEIPEARRHDRRKRRYARCRVPEDHAIRKGYDTDNRATRHRKDDKEDDVLIGLWWCIAVHTLPSNARITIMRSSNPMPPAG